jgi:colanic acid/amylovoran biosynthesis glycosyltransferase
MIKSPLRVLHAFNLYGNPSEIWGFRLLEAFETAGVELGVVTAQYWPGNFPDKPWPIYHLPPLSDYQPQARLRRQLSYLLTPRLLAAPLRTGAWDLLYAHFGPAGWRFAPLAERLGIPLVVSFYGTDYQALPFRRPVWRRRYADLFRRAARVLAEGAHGAGLLREMGCPPEKIGIQRLGVLPGEAPDWNAPRPPGGLRLVQVASFVEKKGQEDALCAFALALPDCPGATLTLAGDGGAQRRVLADLARVLGVQEQVFFQDFIPYPQLRRYLSGFDVFIHPSRTARDLDSEGGIPTILLEAMAAGLPVISTRHCDIPELIVHGQQGYLAPERDPAALSQAIRQFQHLPASDFLQFRQAARKQIVGNWGFRIGD